MPSNQSAVEEVALGHTENIYLRRQSLGRVRVIETGIILTVGWIEVVESVMGTTDFNKRNTYLGLGVVPCSAVFDL